jgi:hypothetical protein
MNSTFERIKSPKPNSLEELVTQALNSASQKAKLAERLLLKPNLGQMVFPETGVNQENAEFDSQEIEQVLEKIQICQRPAGRERLWVLSQEQAHQILSQFNKWNLAEANLISAQTSYNLGQDVGKAALDESFGANGEYLDFYRKGDLPQEILEILPPIFNEIQIQELPDCSDPLQNSVENTSDHSRLMTGDVILITCLVEGKSKFKTVHFVVGDDTKAYLKIRETLE